MKFATSSDAIWVSVAAVLWRLALTLWVGAICVWPLILGPALTSSGLAPLLIEDLLAHARARSALLVLLGLLVQVLALWMLQRRVTGLWQTQQGRLLCLAGVLALASALLVTQVAEVQYLEGFIQVLLMFFGLRLLLQPLPE